MTEPDSPQILSIRERYKESLLEKAKLIEGLIHSLGNPTTSRSIKAAHEELHKLAGSSGMYGYDQVSALCRTAMKSAADEETASLLEQLTELKSLLDP